MLGIISTSNMHAQLSENIDIMLSSLSQAMHSTKSHIKNRKRRHFLSKSHYGNLRFQSWLEQLKNVDVYQEDCLIYSKHAKTKDAYVLYQFAWATVSNFINSVWIIWSVGVQNEARTHNQRGNQMRLYLS